MSDVNANIGVHIDTSAALTELKNLQRQIATFHSQISKSSATAAMAQKNLQTNLLNAVNATGKFHAQMGLVRTSTESFTNSLEKNKLSMGEYFRYAGGASRTFGKLFKQEFDTIGKVAEERVKKMQTQYIKMGRDASGAMKAMSITPNTLDMKDYGTQVAISAQKQALFNQLVKQGSTNLLNFGKNTQWAGRQLMVGFTVPLMYLGTTAAKTFMDLEQQALKFKRVYGDMFTTSDETNKALKDVELLAKEFTKYGVAVSKTMEMAASAAAMGKTGAELTAQVAQATRLAILGNVEQEQALETTTSLTNAFGIAAEDLAKKIDFLNSVENQTVVSIEDLTIAIPKAGPVVKQLGGDVEDLAFFLTAMKEGGINASEGANALKSGLASLINPTKKAAEMLNSYGVNIKAIVEGNQGDIKKTVIEFAQALDTLAPLDRSRAIEQLFGKFQFARLSTLFQNITKDGTQANRVLQMAGASVEQLAILSERELKAVEDAIGTNFKEAVETLKLTIAPIGKTFLEAVTPIIKGLANIFDKFNNLGEGTQKFIVVMTTLVGLIGPTLLMTFGLLANGAANIIKLFLALRTGFLKLTGNTKILGESTQYLNSEQLEAATVAASLNQAHTKLTQSFKLETTAVLALRNAYLEATTAATKFALANPGMMVPGAKGKVPKKFARGTTYVPGTGNKDTVASMLTPGEAVIPAPVAQNPKFQPIIDAMVSGKLQGFNEGTGEVTQAGKRSRKPMSSKDDFTHVGRSESVDTQKFLKETAGLSDYDKARIAFAEGIQRSQGQAPTVGSYGGLGFAFDKTLNINLAKQDGISLAAFEKEWIKKGPEKWNASGRDLIDNLHGKDSKIIDDAMLAKVREEAAKNGGRVTDDIIKKSFENLPANVKATATYKSMDTVLKAKAEYGITGISPNPNTSKAVLEKAAKLGLIADVPVVIIDGDALEYNGKRVPPGQKLSQVLGTPGFEYPTGVHSIVERTNSKGKKVAGAIHGYDPRFPNDPINLSSGSRRVRGNIGKRKDLKAIPTQDEKRTKKRLSARSLAEMKKIDEDVKKSSMAKVKPTDFGTLVSPTSGRSFPVAGIGGVYEKDGNKVFVKPMIDEKSAKAELRANEIARKVHGLDTPEQVMKVMADPNNKKRKIIVLESKFDPKFAEDNIKKNFTKGEYFKQLVAANLRADADLKKGNLGGNVLTDPGAAGVFDRASGRRDFAKQLPSMLEMAEKNLSGVKGGAAGRSPYWFGNETVSIAKNMTADQYHRAMNAEIDRALKKLEPVIAGFGITDPQEKQVYQAMVDRLKQGKKENWRALHAKHSSLLVKPDEMLEDEKGKLTKPKTKGKPSGTKSSSGKLADSKLTDKPKKGKRIVNVARRGPRGFIVPGQANAPLSQADQIRQRAAQEGISTSTARRRLVAEGKLVEGIKKQSDAINETTKAQITAKQKLSEFSQKAGLGIGAISGLTVAASFAGGKAGEMAQAIMPFVFGLQGIVMLLPMLTNPWVAAIAAIALVGGSMLKMAKDIEDARKAGVNLAKSMNMTSDKLQNLAETTGTVSASEEASRKREGILTGEDAVQRKFGQNILGGDFGKGLLADIEKQAKSGQGIQQIGKNISNSLAYAVVQGVISTDQAKSIASALGEELKSYEIPAIVSGRLVTLLGPNGENLTTDPLQVTLAIQKDSMERQADFFKTALENIKPVFGFGTKTNILGMTAAGAVAGGAIGSTAFGVGAIPGAVLGGAAGLIGGLGSEFSQKGARESNANLGAAALQLGLEQVTMNNGLVDSLNKQYDIKVKMAKTDKEIKDIEDERKKALDTLNAENSKALNLLIAQKDAFGPDIFTKGINAAIDALYKEGPMKVFADEAKKELEGLKNSDFKAMLQVEFASGSLDPVTVMKLANNEEIQSKFTALVETQGSEQANLLMQLLMKTGANDTNLPIFMDIINKDPKNFDKNMKAVSVLANMRQKYGITIDVNDDGAAQIKEVVAITEKLAGITGEELTKEAFLNLGITGNMSGPDFDKLWTTLVGTSSTINKSVIVDFVAAGDMNVWNAYQTAIKAKPLPGGISLQPTKAQMSEAQAWLVGRQGKLDGKVPGGPVETPTDVPRAGKDSALDDILNKLKRTRNASIDAQGGVKELLRILSGKKDITAFKGLDQQLAKLGANQGFIDFIGNMDKSLQGVFLKSSQLKKGIVELTDKGKAALKSYNEAVLGDYQNSNRQTIAGLVAQRAEFTRLNAITKDTALSTELLADANFAVALSSAKTVAEVKALIASYKELERQKRATAMTIAPVQTLQEEFDAVGSTIERYFSLTQQVMQAQQDAALISAERTVRSAQRLVEDSQRSIQKIQDEIDGIQITIDKYQGDIETNVTRKIEGFQDQISGIEKAIETNFNIPISILQEESSDLANDLTLLDRAADAINKKYDLQAEALDKIAQINQEIIAQDKQKISLADALSSGDISAAAQAIQVMRQGSASASSKSTQDLLNSAKQAELDKQRNASGLTRIQIEERQFQISQAIYRLEEAREIREAAIEKIKRENILPLEEERARITALIRIEEDKIAKITNGILLTEKGILKTRTDALEEAQYQLTVLQRSFESQSDALRDQQIEWANVKAGIAAAELSTIDFQEELRKAIALAEELANALGGVGATRYIAPRDDAESIAAGEAFIKTVETLDAAQLAYDAAVASGNMYGVRNAGIALTAAQKAYDATLPVIDPNFVGGGGGTNVQLLASGGMVMPKYFAAGGYSRGTDTVPAMLSPGEFVMSKYAVSSYGLDKMKAMNTGTYEGEKVYNYNLSVNVKSDSNPDDIARVVIKQIQQLDNQRIRKQGN